MIVYGFVWTAKSGQNRLKNRSDSGDLLTAPTEVISVDRGLKSL